MSQAETTSAGTGRPATVGQWLQQLTPEPPRALQDELNRLLTQHAHRPAGDIPEVCLQAGEQLLAELVASGSTERETALTLLSVDALVTYAFEAASHDASRLEERTAGAMQRIARLGNE